jgi:acetyl-CoA carboxylase biotin carboxyl carrier protein
MELKDIEALIRIFEKGSLAEMRLREGDFALSLKKTSSRAPERQAETIAGTVAEPAPAVKAEAGEEIVTSPIVGTFYRAPAPDAPPFAQPGSVIRAGKPLCVLEAMKSMNQLDAEFDCEVLRVIAENGALVQFGTPLFEVRRV